MHIFTQSGLGVRKWRTGEREESEVNNNNNSSKVSVLTVFVCSSPCTVCLLYSPFLFVLLFWRKVPCPVLCLFKPFIFCS